MKKYYLILLLAVFYLGILSATPGHVFAASTPSYGEQYLIKTHNYLDVTGYPTGSGKTSGWFTFSESGDFTAQIFDLNSIGNSTTRDYSGTYSLNKKGTVMTVQYNPDPAPVLQQVVSDWIVRWGTSHGKSISNVVFVKFHYPSSLKASVNKKTGLPTQTIVQCTGKIQATVNGHSLTRSFLYQSTIIFYNQPYSY